MTSSLRWWTKAGYGSAEFGLVAVEVLIQVYLLKFYNVTVGLSPVLTGAALAIGIIWDAVSDPVMGRISDRTRHGSGRRRPYLIPGAVGLAVFFILLYNPPSLDSTVFKFLYLLVSYLFFNTFVTLISVPHIALGGELSFDRHERTEVFAYRRLFSTLGLVLGTVLPALILQSLGGEDAEGGIAQSRSLTAWLLAVPVIGSAALSFWSTRGLDAPFVDEPGAHQLPRTLFRDRAMAFLVAQKDVWRNRVFLPLLLAAVVAGFARTLNGSIALYYYEYRLGLSEDVIVLKVLLPYFLSLLAFIPFWIWASRRFGKKKPAMTGVFGLGLLTVVVYPLAPPNSLTLPVAAALIGGFFSGAIVILDSLVPDAVDFDELESHENREGLYFGVWRFGSKLARACGLLIAGALLGAIGFEEAALVQPEDVTFRLALVFGPVVGMLFILAAAVFGQMPFTDAEHERAQLELKKSRVTV